MTTNLPRIDYYFDVISPYSYIGFETLQQLQHQWNGVEIRYIPFALANVMKESRNKPPGALSVRWDMMMIDLKRSAKFLDISLTPNPFFMKWIRQYRSTDAMKILLVLEERDPELMERTAREMWHRVWSRSEKIFEYSDFVEIMNAVGIQDIEEVIETSKEEKYQIALERNTEYCTRRNAYGAPWINVTTTDGAEHSFFGSDRFHLIADLLNQPQPLPQRLFQLESRI